MSLLARGLVPLLWLLALPAAADAPATSGWLPAGFFSYEQVQLPNGLRIVSQRVNGAPYVSARLVVKTGTDHFPCADRELPHLVEHLLFSANSRWAEEAIDAQVRDWGGGINAFTYPEQTDIVLDVHRRYQAPAMQLLADMVGAFDPQPDDVAREVGVVERESGVAHTPLRLWWSRQSFVQPASTRFFLDAGVWCAPGIRPVRHLRVEDVRQAYANGYGAANMVLILVGDLDDAGLAAARTAFAALPAGAAVQHVPLPITQPAGEDYRAGWLSGTANLDAPTAIGIAPFTDWAGYYTLLLVENWLFERLYRDLRTARGMAYTPQSSVDYHGTALVVTLAAETTGRDTAFVLDYLRTLTDEVRTQGISEADFLAQRDARLLSGARAWERITDRADYLAASIREIEDGSLFNTEHFYATLDYPTFRALLARDWPARFAVFDDSPPVSWGGRLALLGGSLLLLVVALGWRAWQRLRAAPPG